MVTVTLIMPIEETTVILLPSHLSSISVHNGFSPAEVRIDEDLEAFRKMKQYKSSNKPPGGGDQKSLVNVKDASCSFMMGPPTKEWGELPSPGLMFCQASTQGSRQNQAINNSVRKGDSRIMHVGDTILDAAVEAVID